MRRVSELVTLCMSLRVAHVALLCFLPVLCCVSFHCSAMCIYTALLCVLLFSAVSYSLCVFPLLCSVSACCSVSRLHVSQCHPPVGTRAIVWHRSRPIRHCNIISFVFPPIPPRPHPATQLPGCALSIALYQSGEPEIFG